MDVVGFCIDPPDGVETPRPMESDVLAFQNLTYHVQGRGGPVQVLAGVSACVPVGSLCAVLGPSGCGKSSLFDVLCGVADMTRVHGRVTTQMSLEYVTQESTLVVTETVNDVMWFYTHLALERTVTNDQKRVLIDTILKDMDLDHCRTTHVGGVESAYGVLIQGGLSSGERRRLQVAAALISKPDTICLDEPTTGLDATNALHLIQRIRRLCLEIHMTAVASLHQCRREIMLELDMVILMAHGCIIYSGPQKEVLSFVEPGYRSLANWENPMDFILAFLTSLTPREAQRANTKNNAASSSVGTVHVVERQLRMEEASSDNLLKVHNGMRAWGRIRVHWSRTARIYTYRWSIYNWTGPAMLLILVGLFMAIVCLKINKSDPKKVVQFINMQSMIAFMLARNSLHTSAVAAFTRTCWFQERSQKTYKARDAFLALVLFELPMGFIFGVMSYLVMWAPVGWDYKSPDRLWKALLLFALAAGPLRAVFSAVQLSSRSSSSARLIATFSLMEATGGVYLRYKNVPAALRWINFMNPYFYTIMGLIKIEFDHYQFPGGFSQDVVAHFGYDDFTLEQVFWVLCMLFAIYTIVAFIAFRAVNSSKHVVDMSMEDNSRDTWGRRHGLKKGVLAGIGSNSNITTGAGTAAEPLLAVGPGQLGQHSSYVNLLGNTPGSFQSKNDMSPAQTREKAISGGSTLVGETASLMPPSASSSGPTPRYGSVGHIVDNSLPSQLQYVDLTYTVEDSTGAVQGEAKQILKGMTFEIQRGTMFAIMGPSGAGKTTLLGILGMRTMRGDLEFTRFTKVKKCDIAYVPADDVLPVLDTVMEVLTFYAQFVLPKHYTKARRQARVTEVARVMGLQHVTDSFVGGSLGMGVTCRGISGGERRRLSIGSALLKNPAMLVLDEPTSGLDSEMSMVVMATCSSLTLLGHTVVCTIHQPRADIYRLFNEVMYMAKGTLVWRGPPAESVGVFEQLLPERAWGANNKKWRRLQEEETKENIALMYDNPSDFILDCLVGLEAEDIASMKAQFTDAPMTDVVYDTDKEEQQQVEEEDNEESGPPFTKRFRILVQRRIRETIRHQDQLLERLQMILVTITISTMAYTGLHRGGLREWEITDRRGLMAIFTMFLVVQASNSIPHIQQHRTLSLHEMKSGFYRASEYYWSQVVIGMLVFAPVTVFIGFNMMSVLAGYRAGYTYYIFGMLNAFLLSAYAEMSAAIIGILMPSYPAAVGIYTGPFTCGLVPSSGILIATPATPWPIRILAYINPIHYLVGAEFLNQFEDRAVRQNPESTVQSGYFFAYDDGNAVVHSAGFDLDTGNKYYNVGAALALMALISFWGIKQMPLLFKKEHIQSI